MEIEVEYIDANGVVSNRIERISKIALIKHLAIAGQGYAPTPQKLLRSIGMLFHYAYYLQRDDFYNHNRFSQPPTELSDPTEVAQFSNVVGKAIADFLSKKISNSIFTVNYEAAMRLVNPPLRIGRRSRPDLIAFTQNSLNAPNSMFAIEAKGFTAGAGSMAKHKRQSQTGGIPVNYSVACISYELYQQVKCNYHDPFNDTVEFDRRLLSELTKKYYLGLSGFVRSDFFRTQEMEIQGENFYSIDLSYPHLRRFFDPPPFRFLWDEIFHFFRPKLILPRQILEFSENGVNGNIRPFIFEGEQSNRSLYIDTDRVGLQFERI